VGLRRLGHRVGLVVVEFEVEEGVMRADSADA
jgi:hypothetical protein